MLPRYKLYFLTSCAIYLYKNTYIGHIAIYICFASDGNFKYCCFFKNIKYGTIVHDNPLLSYDSYVTSYLIYFETQEKMSQKFSSAAVVIGALRASY